MRRLKDIYFWLVVIIVTATILSIVAVFNHWLHLNFHIGPLYFTHWLAIIGTAFIAVYVPIYSFLKRHKPNTRKSILVIHVLGNLIAVMLVSIHFTSQITRPQQALPQFGTGILLYFIMFALVVSGIIRRFGILSGLERYWKFLHINLAVSFYLVIVVHVLHGLHLL